MLLSCSNRFSCSARCSGVCCLCKPQLLTSPFSTHFTLQTRSKSLSDIPLVCPAHRPPGGTAADEGSPDAGTAAQWEGGNGGRPLARDSEAQWQDVSPVHSTHTTMCCLCCLQSCFCMLCVGDVKLLLTDGHTGSVVALKKASWHE